MNTVHAVWEQTNLGVNTWETSLTEADDLAAYAQAEREMIAQGAQYLVVKTPVNHAPFLFGLPKLGYAYVETLFHVSIRREEYQMPQTIARFDRGLSVAERTDPAQWEPVFERIRAGVFKSDRVSIDPAFTQAQAGNRYANWLAQMLGAGCRLFETLRDGQPLGFFVIRRVDADTVDPVLMGMYDEANDRGMGALLHKKTLDTCFTMDCKRLTSTIVSNNAKVLRVYVNAGATLTDTLYTYVRHLPGAPDANRL